MKKTHSIGFPSLFVVVGTNPEMADYDNPRGEIIQERFYAVAEDSQGNRRVWGEYYVTPEEAEAAYVLFAPPVAVWEKVRPAYGSEAYVKNQRQYQAEDISWEKETDEWSYPRLVGFRF